MPEGEAPPQQAPPGMTYIRVTPEEQADIEQVSTVAVKHGVRSYSFQHSRIMYVTQNSSPIPFALYRSFSEATFSCYFFILTSELVFVYIFSAPSKFSTWRCLPYP